MYQLTQINTHDMKVWFTRHLNDQVIQASVVTDYKEFKAIAKMVIMDPFQNPDTSDI